MTVPSIRLDILMVTGTTTVFGRPGDVEQMLRMALAVTGAAKSSIIIPPGTLEGPHLPELD